MYTASLPDLIRALRRAAMLMAIPILAATLSGCVSIPKNATAVRPFDLERYKGTWYEMARMDFRFERNLDNVTAEYTDMDDGKIRVRNRGRDTTTGKWKESIGKARQLRGHDDTRLKVSFFGPFYSGYNVVKLDPEYRYALIAGDNLKYMWILSRKPELPADVRTEYLAEAVRIGYDTAKLVWTGHNGAR